MTKFTTQQEANGTWAAYEGGGFRRGGFDHELQAQAFIAALRANEGECAQPVAFVPIHPTRGPLWMETYPSETDVSQTRSANYPVHPLYA